MSICREKIFWQFPSELVANFYNKHNLLIPSSQHFPCWMKETIYIVFHFVVSFFSSNRANLFAQEQIFLRWGLVVKPLPSDEALNHSETFQNISHIPESYNINLLMPWKLWIEKTIKKHWIIWAKTNYWYQKFVLHQTWTQVNTTS